MDHQKTEELKEDKPGTESSGRQTHGDFCGYFSCPLGREVVLGVETYHQWLRTRVGSIMAKIHTLTLPKQGVTLCACHVIMPSSRDCSCVLDVNNNIITSLGTNPETFAGHASPKPSGNDSSTLRSNDNEKRIDLIRPGRRKRTSGKKVVPVVAKPGGMESGTHNAIWHGGL